MFKLPRLHRTKHSVILVAFIAAFGVIGGLVILFSHAAQTQNSIEPETGTVSAEIIPSTAASNGAAVKFKANGTDITTYGAKGDSSTDDTAALNRAFSTAPANSTLIIPAGKTFKHDSMLTVTVAGLHVTGSGTILATNPDSSAIRVAANNVTFDGGMTLKFNTAGQVRHFPYNSDMLFYDHVGGGVIRNITIDGSPSIGMLVFGGYNYVIEGITVQNTLADAIHNTGGAHDGLIKDVIIKNAADDAVAVVSYLNDGPVANNIRIENPKLYGQTWGRGFTVVGGSNITYVNVYAENSAGAAIYVAAESEYNTYGNTNIKYLGGTLVNSNQTSEIDHGAIMVYDSQAGASVTNVDIRDMVIKNTRTGAARQVAIVGNGASDGAVTGIQFKNIAITGGGSSLFYSEASGGAYNTINWTFNGTKQADHTGFTPYP